MYSSLFLQQNSSLVRPFAPINDCNHTQIHRSCHEFARRVDSKNSTVKMKIAFLRYLIWFLIATWTARRLKKYEKKEINELHSHQTMINFKMTKHHFHPEKISQMMGSWMEVTWWWITLELFAEPRLCDKGSALLLSRQRLKALQHQLISDKLLRSTKYYVCL